MSLVLGRGSSDELGCCKERVDGPQMLAPGGRPVDQAALEALFRQGPVMVGSLWDSKVQLSEPVFLEVAGSKPLLYRGKSHAFIGEPGRGKSMIAQYLLTVEAASGRCSLFLDLEKNFGAFRERIGALGATRETASRIGYWRLTKQISPEALRRIGEFISTWNVECVVIDSVGRALSRAGLDENSNDDVRRWYDATVEPLLRLGATVVLIDHFKRPNGGPRGTSVQATSRYAKGAGAKLDVIDGAAYGVHTVTTFSRTKSGSARLLTSKDNNGLRAEDEIACEVAITPSDEGREINLLIKAPDSSGLDGGETSINLCMERVSRFLEGQTAPINLTRVRDGVEGRAQAISESIERLVAEGFVSEERGARNARLMKSQKAYRQANEESL